jgi:uncharacterized membrane protein YqaE (UPF0057 family)
MRAMFLLAVLAPPLAATLCRPRSLLVNFVLTLAGWLPGAVHATMIVAEYYSQRDTAALVSALRDADIG